MDAYKIKATLGAQVVTVWAQLAATNSFTVNATGPGTPNSSGCGANGSRYPVGRGPARSGGATLPDCGVLWRGPTPAARVRATGTGGVDRGAGDRQRPGPHTLPARP